tara:strand:- start:357 stop:1022 length:666 start_codon:yes stop_codon:yes gene_type:complete
MYIPKNRIKPNLFTPGNEFILKSNNENYIGFYHSLWNGKFFTGKTQNDSNIREIIKFEVPELKGTSNLPQNLTSENVIALFLEDPDPLIGTSQWNQGDIITYLELQGKSPLDDDPKSMPNQSYPNPTEEDYELGSFTRYFAVKVNELKYLELDYDVYKKLKKKDANWSWELYNCFSIQWTLKGQAVSVGQTNKNQVLIAEQKNKKLGLQAFLQGNYLKFYR